MVPVKLQLQNFLSYGTDAPPLDFREFQVACLSGKNGQGKSALLDAMTWAIWGEARKSSGKRKPDDELIRIGTRHMEVSFVFDIEGDRYRATRTFTRSKTGKTTQSDLEFHLYAPDADAYRPLTGSTQRETQSIIDDTLGLDYDTFINSAFLLQGRSDEFTQKRPSERKQILASILNLSKYEDLAGMARDRWREAKHNQQDAESDIERLEAQLADVPEWNEQRDEVEAAIAKKQDALDTLRAEQQALTEKKADLEAKAREAASVQERLRKLEDRIVQYREDAKQLQQRIDDAKALLDRKDAIQQRYERYEALQAERDELDEKRDLHRGLEKQIEQTKAELQHHRTELEKELNRLEVERKSHQKELQTCTAKLSQRASVQEELAAARTAKERLQTLKKHREQRDAINQRIASIDQELVGQREKLKAQWTSVQEQIEQAQEVDQKKSVLEAQVKRLQGGVERREQLATALDATRQEGVDLNKAINERAGELEAWRNELEREQADLGRLQDAEAGSCPTCGSELTDSHRAEVQASYRERIESLQQRIRAGEAWLEQRRNQREALRTKYKKLQEQRTELAEVPEQLATAREKLRSLKDAHQKVEALQKQAEHLQSVLENGRFGAMPRKRRQALKQRRAELGFDETTYEKVRDRASQLQRYEERLKELEEYSGRKEQLEKKLEHNKKRAEALRAELESGQKVQQLQQQKARLKQQLDRIEFDPERFDAVRARLKELSAAGSDMNDLVNAQQNREDWEQQLKRVRSRIDAAQQEKADQKQALEELQERLDQQDQIQAKVKAKADAVAEVEQELTELQQRRGELNERLNQAERDREALKEARLAKREAQSNRNLYKHLRKAFGKHGIPSLIIEETLPEIEERANRLLDRLTDGKMHIQLETLKDKKTGGTKETLEIIITDEQGVPRPYETFSGGESFRVNFALRIALAQLLAERSGVRIRTLVIDEGFGTQDMDGIQRLVESINTIQDDFAKILVITHLERLKQAFPVRIEVEKDPVTGSSFEVMGV